MYVNSRLLCFIFVFHKLIALWNIRSFWLFWRCLVHNKHTFIWLTHNFRELFIEFNELIIITREYYLWIWVNKLFQWLEFRFRFKKYLRLFFYENFVLIAIIFKALKYLNLFFPAFILFLWTLWRLIDFSLKN